MSEIHLIHDTCVTPPGWRVEDSDGRPRGASKAGSQRLTTSASAIVADNPNGLTGDLRDPGLLSAWHIFIAPTLKPNRAAGRYDPPSRDQVNQAGENYGRKD